MRRRAVDFHPTAIEEASAARKWYAERSVAAAAAFVNELDDAIDRVSRSPEFCPPYLHGPRRFLLKRFPYLVVFREIADRIQVVAVAHGHRKPGYWKARDEAVG